MGADLYIKDLPRKSQFRGYEVSQEAVDNGYFRDCYNSSGLFTWLTNNSGISFSWWNLLRKNKSWFRDDEEEGSCMTVDGAKQFLKILLAAEKNFVKKPNFVKVTDSWIEGKEIKYKFDEQTEEESLEYFKWFNLLLQLVKAAIKRKSEIIWSV